MKLPRCLSGVSRLTLLVTAMAAGAAQAPEDYADGLTAYYAGDTEHAARIMRRWAGLGNAKAQYFLGTLYRIGEGVERSPAEAFRWYRQAAEHGLVEAQFQLGVMYLRGEGVAENEDRAFDWLWQAADRGYPQAREVLEFVLYERDFTYGC